MRLPLAVDLESRDGGLTKGALCRNALVEVQGEKLKMRKRPGTSDYATIRTGVAQLLTYWRGQTITVIDDYVDGGNGGAAPTSTTLNPSDKGTQVTLSGGNLGFSVAAVPNGGFARSIASISSGWWYFEVAPGSNNQTMIGVANASANVNDNPSNAGLHTLVYQGNGAMYRNNVNVGNGASYTTGDTVGVLIDASTRVVKFYKNGTLQATFTSANVPAGALYALCGAGSSGGGGTADFDEQFSQNLNPATADLPMSSQDNGMNAPTPYLMIKNSQQAWTMDINGGVTSISDVDYPSSYTVTLTSLTRSGTTATATTAADTNFHVGDSITVAGANESDYNGTKIVTSVTPSAGALGVPLSVQSITRSGSTATATTVEPHALTNGQTVLIEGAAQSEYNGNKTITWLSATTFSFSVTVTGVTSPATGTAAVAVMGSGLLAPFGTGVVTVSGGTATVTSAAPHGLATGASVAVSYYVGGVYQYAAYQSITVTNTTTFTLAVSTSDATAVSCSFWVNFTASVSSVATSDGITATVTCSGDHGFATGTTPTLQINGLLPPYYNFAGSVLITSATAFTYLMNGSAGYPVPATSPVTPATGTITATPRTQTSVGASFTFEVANSPTTPATGTITATGGKNTVPGIVYFEGYFLVMDVNGVVYNSAEDDPQTWNALEYLIAQTETGEGKAIARTVNYVVCFKEWSTEFLWYPPNDPPGSPFSQVPNSANLIGCAEGWSVAEVAGNLLWIGQGKKVKGRGVYMMSGTQPQKVSSPDVDRVIALDSLAEVYAYGIELDGHPCYVLTLGTTDVTLVYDLVSKVWGVWSSLTLGSSKSISSITLSGTTATVTFGVAHTLNDGDPVLIAGANQAAYNGIHQVSYVSTTVVTIEVAAGTVTPATGTITGTPYTESCFKLVKYANCGGLNLGLHESDGHLYKLDSTLFRDAGIPIRNHSRSKREDGGTVARKKLPRISLIADSVSDTCMVRWSDDDCQTFSAYRRITLSDVEPMTRQCGAFHRRTFEYLHIGNTAPNAEALEMEVTR